MIAPSDVSGALNGPASLGAGPPPAPESPSWTDPTAARASEAIGGPIGRYAASARRWTALSALLLITAGTLLLAFAQKSPCADGNWQHNKQYTHVCYGDILPLWSAEGLDKKQVPYRDHPVEYPVLTGGFMYAAAEVTRAIAPAFGVGDADLGILFGLVTVVGLAVCGLLVAYFTIRAARGRPWDAAIFAFSPLLIFHAFSNWDLLAMAFTSAALFAWSRNRPATAGVLIGLGTAAKLYPGLLLVALVILAVRSGKRDPVVRAVVGAVVAWLVVNVPIAYLWFDGWKTFYTFSASREAEASTFWAMYRYLRTGGGNVGSPGGFHPNGALVAVMLLAALALVAALAWMAPTRPRLAQVVLLVVAAFLLTTKVWSPQYSLWLVPLVALARPRWRLTLIWQGSEIVVWIVTLLWLAGFTDTNRGIDYGWLMFLLLVRDGFLLAILALVVQEMWHPELDVVRSGGHGATLVSELYGVQSDADAAGGSDRAYIDDPSGGPFDGAPDAWSLSRAARAARATRRAPTLVDVTVGAGPESEEFPDADGRTPGLRSGDTASEDH